MAKWNFSYSKLDGRRGHFKVTAGNKIEAIKTGMERAKKDGETITKWDCKLMKEV